MSPDCYCGVTLLKKNKEEFEASTSKFDSIDYEDDNVVTGTWERAPYGYENEFKEMALNGCTFFGFSGTCGEFSPLRFCAVDGQYCAVETATNGDVVARVDEDASLLDGDAIAVRHYFVTLKRIRNMFGFTEGGRDKDDRPQYPY